MTLSEFYSKLENHDWYYMFSDDVNVHTEGFWSEHYLFRIADGNPEFIDLYERFKLHHFSGEGFGTERAPKPVRLDQLNG